VSEYFDLPDLFGSPEEFQRAQEERLGKLAELQQKIAEATGTARSEDDRIVVTYSEGNGVEEIRFDPRVMRMPSEDLAAEVARLVNEARADARRQMQQLVSETFGEPTAIVDQLPEFQRTVDEVLRDTHQMRDQLDVLLDRMRKMTE
jgi:DNA-binding protein YbaB